MWHLFKALPGKLVLPSTSHPPTRERYDILVVPISCSVSPTRRRPFTLFLVTPVTAVPPGHFLFVAILHSVAHELYYELLATHPPSTRSIFVYLQREVQEEFEVKYKILFNKIQINHSTFFSIEPPSNCFLYWPNSKHIH